MEELFSFRSAYLNKKQDFVFFRPTLKQKKVTEGCTHIKNGVLPIADAIDWLTKHGFFNLKHIPEDIIEEEEQELENGLVGLLKLLLG